MGVKLEVTTEFGYVMLVVVLSMLEVLWMTFKVVQARKKFKVWYPKMYSEDCKEFNCYQRVHQNTLETYGMYLVLLLLGGLRHPVISSVGGMIWIVGRYFYATGYYTGDPRNRMRGVWCHIGTVMCLGCTVSGALGLLGYV